MTLEEATLATAQADAPGTGASPPLNVLLLSTYDVIGGGARAAYRLHEGLRRHGVTSKLLVQRGSVRDPHLLRPESPRQKLQAHVRKFMDAWPVRRYRGRNGTPFTTGFVPSRLPRTIEHLNPDVVNLHWVGNGFVSIEAIRRIRQPIVWTLHDMWAFTGGCHYDQECGRYRDQCGACPQLGSSRERDLSRRVWQRKERAWRDVQLTLVTPSRWLAECVRASSLFRDRRVEVIPNGLDLSQYRPMEHSAVRRILGVPADKRLLLFGAMDAASDRRKGFHHLEPALHRLAEGPWADQVELIVFGSGPPAHPPDLRFPTHYLGRLHDDLSLSMIYAAADVFLAPSVQDNLPSTVMEALACGTPVVGFGIGGMPDLVTHRQTGYLAAPFDVEDLARGIAWTLDQEDRAAALRHRARAHAERSYSLERQAELYTALFASLIE